MGAVSEVSPGLPVELGEIDRQLGLLWEQSDAGKVRASLINLVIYSESPDAIATNTPLLAEIAGNHAFRALLVQAAPQAPEPAVRAWITAHCHLRGAGREICSEQITFQLDGSPAGRLPNIVFSHLDSDLPLYLWWQGPLHPDPEPDLWRWVDRLIVDSSSWPQPGPQFRLLRETGGLARGRGAVCDLTWTRLFNLRYAVAQLFDHPAACAALPRLSGLTITHGPGDRLAALQLLGWITSRMGWHLDTGAGSAPALRRGDGGVTDFTLRESPEAAGVAGVAFDLGGASARVTRAPEGDFFLLEVEAEGRPLLSQLVPGGRDRPADTLLAELGRSSRHPLYWPAIRAIEPLLHAA
jgi:glucose-6-phosphate dehydrogenase assembly protein OpcA